MKKIILFICVGLFIYGCNNNDSSDKFKEMKEIEKLTKKQFSEEAGAIYANVFQEIGKLLNKHEKIDVAFEKDIDILYQSSVKQMLEYGKVLANKEEQIREDYLFASTLAAWDALDKIDPKVSADVEKQLDERMHEFEEYQSLTLERKFDDLFAIMDFLNFEKLKEERPESAKEFGIQ
ncbi:MAG: hypothetical protein PHR79_08885 [Bacteroidales bacterium]|nr:hypothetical protein [Bacteroidales bacterium]